METVKNFMFGTPPTKPKIVVNSEGEDEDEEEQAQPMSDTGITDSGSESGVKSEKETGTKTK